MISLDKCEDVLLDAGYIFARPDEDLFIFYGFGQVWLIVTVLDADELRKKLEKISSAEELEKEFYCYPVQVINLKK